MAIQAIVSLRAGYATNAFTTTSGTAVMRRSERMP